MQRTQRVLPAPDLPQKIKVVFSMLFHLLYSSNVSYPQEVRSSNPSCSEATPPPPRIGKLSINWTDTPKEL
jgi:hypothetical protein